MASVISTESEKDFQNSTVPLLKRLLGTGKSYDEIASNVLDISASSSVYLAHAAADMVDFYLGEEQRSARIQIIELVKQSNSVNDALLRGYVTESLRSFLFYLIRELPLHPIYRPKTTVRDPVGRGHRRCNYWAREWFAICSIESWRSGPRESPQRTT